MVNGTVQILTKIIGSIVVAFSAYLAVRSFFDKGKAPYGKTVKVGLWIFGLFLTLLGILSLLIIIFGTLVGTESSFGEFVLLFIIGALPLVAGVLFILVATGRWKNE